MRITSTNRPDGRHCVALTPEHSGEPNPALRELLIDGSILGTPGDRQMAVAALTFGSYLRGVVETDVPVSPAMSQALSAFQAPVFVAPMNVSVEGTQYTGAGSTLVLDLEHEGLVGRNSVDRGQVITLDVLPMTTWTGRLFSMDRLVTASNADLLGRRARGTARLGPFLAVALAFSHELHVSRIVVPSGDRSDEPWITRATDLLAATGVDLMTVDRSELHDLDLVEG
ncbi:hypothetical protein [Brachybacterium sp. UNK5269]|uniref:hypothetical protein n=1 Tax=Brachybacterium sp. UNK5269 TaxID=3408576 RepID=UPI003BB02BB0